MAIYYGDGSNSNNGRIIQHDEDYGSLSRYTINNGSWHEVDSGFRCAFTPKAVGNILKCTLVYNPVLMVVSMEQLYQLYIMLVVGTNHYLVNKTV